MDAMSQSQFGSGLGSLLGGLFGNSGAPYDAAMEQYSKYGKQAASAQNPFYQAGQNAIPQYQGWLQGQQDPSAFINHLMSQYQQSPWANYQQNQSVRAGQNAASASGLTGSTPFAQQLQQNAQNISSEDMQKWLANVLGINTQYGAGQAGLIGGGQNAANALTGLYNNQADRFGEAAYGRQHENQNDFWNTLGGGFSLLSSFL